MDPFTLALAVAIAYVVFPADTKTLRATRGAVGVARAAGSGASGHIRAERARTAGTRAQARQSRHKRLSESGRVGRARVRAERAASKAWHGAAGTIRAAHAAVKAAPSGYAPAADRAVQRRAEWRARRARPDAAVTPTETDSTPTAPTSEETTVPIAPTPDYAIRTSELTSLDVFRAEISNVIDQTREHLEAGHCLRAYGASLLERYADAEFGTRLMAQAVGDVHENTPKASAFLGFEEALAGLLRAIDAAQDIAEAVSSQGATGKTEAFTAS
jgi:hypothetical protein